MAILVDIPAGDLALSDSGDLVWSTGPEYIRQRLSARFQFFLGEYFLDTRQGIPYFRDVLVKNPDMDLIRLLFRRVILETPGVLSIVSFDLDFDQQRRRLAFEFQAKVEGGEVTVNPADQDFLVDLAA